MASQHEITLNITVQPSGDRFTATAHFAVPYVAWGLKKPEPSNLSLRRKVYVDVKTKGR